MTILSPLYALNCADIVKQSDSSMNKDIIEFIFSEDYETALSIMRALGQREDSYVEDIISTVFSTYPGDEFYKNENLLEELLSSLFAAQHNRALLSARFNQNKAALHELIINIPHIYSPALKRHLIRLIPLAGHEKYRTVLAQEAESIIILLKANAGYAEKAVDQELITLLKVVAELELTDLAEICITISYVSGNRDIVQLSRQVASGLLKK